MDPADLIPRAILGPMDLAGSYDRVARTYGDRIAGELAHKPFDREILARFADGVRGRGPVCDAGCGPGHVAAHLAGLGIEVVGVDLSPGMVAEARRRFPALEFRTGDLLALDGPPGGWAGIAAMYSILHAPPEEHPRMFAGLRARLRPGGLLLLAFHLGTGVLHLDDWWGVPVDLDFRFLEREPVEAALAAAGFTMEESTERDPYPDVEHPSRRAYLLARS